jgi:hypothetical protein
MPKRCPTATVAARTRPVSDLPRPNKRNPKAVGEVVESLFFYEGVRRGLTMLRPQGDNAGYDAAADRGPAHPRDRLPRLVTVQVRAVIRRCRRQRRKAYRLFVYHRNNTQPLMPDEADILAAYVVPENAWYLIPVREFAPTKQLPLYPHLPDFPGPYERWREAWHLLAPGRSKDWVIEKWNESFAD